MSAESVVKTLRLLWRADRIIADIQLRRMAAGLAARAFAGLFAAFGILLLELAAYFALVQIWNAITATVVLGIFNFLFAGLILLIAKIRTSRGRDYETAMALHNSAVEALQLQIRSFEPVRFSSLETFLPLAVPAIGLLVKTLRKSASGSQ